MPWHVQLIPEAAAELARLESDMQADFLRVVELLIKFGPQHVGLPYVRPLGGKLWEIRMNGQKGIARAIYVARTGQRLVVLHAFVKKTQKTPQRAIKLAFTRLKRLRDD